MYCQYLFFTKCLQLVFDFFLLHIFSCPRNKELFTYFKYKAFKIVLLRYFCCWIQVMQFREK